MYYAFEFFSGRKTTTGDANPRTGRMSKAGYLGVFKSKAERNDWVNDGKITSGMGGNCREVVSRREARKLCRGESMSGFLEYIRNM